MKPLIFVDLDRTLFDVVDFWNDFSKVFAGITNTDELSLINSYRFYSKHETKLRYIDYDSLVERYQINHDEILSELKQLSKYKTYIYKDGLSLIKLLNNSLDKLDWAILTFGQTKFQSMKLEIESELINSRQFITQIPKNDFITDYFLNRSGVLIDDKLGQDLPNGWLEVNVDRQSQLSEPLKLADNTYKISTLEQIGYLFKNIIHLL